MNVLSINIASLDAANQMLILKEIAHFRLKLVQGISTIHASATWITRLCSISLLLWCNSSLLRWHHVILLIQFLIHIEVNWQSFGPMKRSISLNNINMNSLMLTIGNPTLSSSLISMIIQRSWIRDVIIWRDALSMCEYFVVDWQMLLPTQQALSQI